VNALARLLTLFALILGTSSAFAVGEQDYYNTVKTQVLPYINAQLHHAKFKSFDGVVINYALLQVPNSKGTIFFSPGRSESIVGNLEVIYDLAQAGYSVAAIDHRGQGYSQRLLKSNASHVVHFIDYVKDFKGFATKAVEAKMPKPYYLFGSSMGAAIGTHFAMINPRFFTKIAFAAPMYQISTNNVFGTLIYGAAKGLYDLGWGNEVPPIPYDFNSPFEKNIVTHSQKRFNFDRWLMNKNPGLQVGAPTTNWILEASRESVALQRQASRLVTPTIILQAGNDSVVNNQAQARVCKAAGNCKLYVVPGSFHCVLSESDQYRNAAIHTALRFFVP
jgi:lysophospholipase